MSQHAEIIDLSLEPPKPPALRIFDSGCHYHGQRIFIESSGSRSLDLHYKEFYRNMCRNRLED